MPILDISSIVIVHILMLMKQFQADTISLLNRSIAFERKGKQKAHTYFSREPMMNGYD